MSVYNRKGGSGKAGSLREQFNYYKRQLEKRLIEEYTFSRARGVSHEGLPKSLFKRLDYEDVFKEGITRKVGNKTIRYIGPEAVEKQIESLRARASKSYQAELYINNYINSLKKVGFSEYNINKIENALKRLSVDKLTYLINENILPQIAFLYNQDTDEDELTEQILNAIKYGVSNTEFKAFKQRKKALKPLVIKEYKLLGGLA